TADDFMGELVQRLSEDGFSLELRVPETQVSSLPFTSELPLEVRDATLQARINAGGTLDAPTLDGRVTVQTRVLERSMEVALDLSSPNDRLRIDAAVARENETLVRALVLVPRFSELLRDGTDVRELLRAPDMVMTLDVKMTAQRLREFLPASISLEGLFEPELTARIEARGSEGGPTVTAGISMAPSQQAPVGYTGFDGTLEVNAEWTPSGANAHVELLPWSGAAPLVADADLGVGTMDVLSGSVDFANVPIDVSLDSDGMPLGWLTRMLPEVFGKSEGTLRADFELGGTIGTPSASGTLDLEFEK